MANQNNPRPPLYNNPTGVYYHTGGSISAYTNVFAQPGNYSVTWNWNVPQSVQPSPPAPAAAAPAFALIRPIIAQTQTTGSPVRVPAHSTTGMGSPNFANMKPGKVADSSNSGVFMNGFKV